MTMANNGNVDSSMMGLRMEIGSGVMTLVYGTTTVNGKMG
jgi:hypothetical protein